jgi:cytochrome c-type biogenesis protein CcmE
MSSSTTGPRAAAVTSSTTGQRIATVAGGTTGQRAVITGPIADPAARGGIPKWAKILITVVIVGGGLGYLLYATAAPEVEWYKHVDEVMAESAAWHGKKLQLHGRVVKGSILRKASGATYEYRFQVEHNGRTVSARHTGLVPDTFKDEAEVVLKGKLLPEGTFQVAPDGVMAKCPSKYEAKRK